MASGAEATTYKTADKDCFLYTFCSQTLLDASKKQDPKKKEETELVIKKTSMHSITLILGMIVSTTRSIAAATIITTTTSSSSDINAGVPCPLPLHLSVYHCRFQWRCLPYPDMALLLD